VVGILLASRRLGWENGVLESGPRFGLSEMPPNCSFAAPFGAAEILKLLCNNRVLKNNAHFCAKLVSATSPVCEWFEAFPLGLVGLPTTKTVILLPKVHACA
jgi:hypothetical protein